MTGGAPLARGGTPAAGTDDTSGGDIPTTGMEPIGTGATAVSGGMLAIPPIPMKGQDLIAVIVFSSYSTRILTFKIEK